MRLTQPDQRTLRGRVTSISIKQFMKPGARQASTKHNSKSHHSPDSCARFQVFTAAKLPKIVLQRIHHIKSFCLIRSKTWRAPVKTAALPRCLRLYDQSLIVARGKVVDALDARTPGVPSGATGRCAYAPCPTILLLLFLLHALITKRRLSGFAR